MKFAILTNEDERLSLGNKLSRRRNERISLFLSQTLIGSGVSRSNSPRLQSRVKKSVNISIQLCREEKHNHTLQWLLCGDAVSR